MNLIMILLLFLEQFEKVKNEKSFFPSELLNYFLSVSINQSIIPDQGKVRNTID